MMEAYWGLNVNSGAVVWLEDFTGNKEVESSSPDGPFLACYCFPELKTLSTLIKYQLVPGTDSFVSRQVNVK